MDLLRKAGLGGKLVPVSISSGETEGKVGMYHTVPKRDLVTGVQVMLQQEGLRIAAGLEMGETLIREMTEMRVMVTVAGRERYGVWREGKHDDLVLAVALACWGARRAHPRTTGEVGWWVRGW